MPLYIYFAAVALGISLPLMAWTVAASRSTAAAIRHNLGTSISRPISAVRRPSAPSRLLPTGYARDLERRIERAGLGGRLAVERFISIKATGVVLGLFVGGILGARLGGPLLVLLPMILVMAVWLLPDLRLTGMAKTREAQIETQLPDVLDQLTISVEAGLGFDSALLRLTQSSEGPVTDQLSRVVQDIRLGLARDAALKALASRTESPDLRTFANAMAQAGRHGLPIASVLRAQAAEAREKRKFRAEERAHKVPVKILIPLILCVLPTLFIVLIGPAVIRYNEGFGG